MRTPVKVFISYSHRDETLKDELDTHLSSLKREGLIEHWHDRMIAPGDAWEDLIEGKLESADLYLFLISPDFINSEYCFGKELKLALERHRNDEAAVLPIVVRPVDWKKTALGQIQALPKDGFPVTTWENIDEAWLNVVDGIRAAIEKVSERKGSNVAGNQSLRARTINSVLITLVERIQERHDSDTPPIQGLGTGLSGVDSLIGGLEKRELILIASVPQVDRLGVLLKFISNLAVEIGLPCALICAKYDEVYLGNRFLCGVGKLPVRGTASGMLTEDQWAAMTYALGKVHEAPLSFISYSGQSVEDLCKTLDELTLQHGVLPVVAVDSLDHLAGDKEKNIQALKTYALRTNKVILICCGLETNPDARFDKRPVLSDVASWVPVNEYIDQVICVYQDQVYRPDSQDIGIAELIIQGVNGQHSGTVRVSYLPESQSYANLKEGKLLPSSQEN